MNIKHFLSALVASMLAFAAYAQSNGIAFVTDVKGDAAMDAGASSAMAEVSCPRNKQKTKQINS